MEHEPSTGDPDLDEGRHHDVTCVRCGWVSFAISMDLARTWAAERRAYFLQRQPAQLGRAPSFSPDYYGCLRCGGSEFRKSVDGDCPLGCTLNPVICETRSPEVT